jgi:hypothetical protein
MATAMTGYSALLQGLPPGAWVAISEEKNEVIAYAADLQATMELAKQKGEDSPLIVRVPDPIGTLFL